MNPQAIHVTKRNGNRELLDLNKFHKVVAWACEGITNVSESEIEIKSQIQFFNNMKTTDIQETLIKAASELISEDTPNYQYVAGRLINYHIRKEIYNSYIPISFYEHITNVTKEDYYDAEILNSYSKEEIDELGKYINHNRDFNIVYIGMEQFREKYLVKNRHTKKLFETPQFAMMLISMVFFIRHEKTTRLAWVKDFYDALSKFEISLPTPIMAEFRTNRKQFSSCVLVETDDSIDSIIATTGAIMKYISQKAGIGVGTGRIRAIGSPVRKGDTTHTGLIGYYKVFQAAVKSSSQGGIRSGSATIYFPLIHSDIEDVLVLKNSKGIEETRVRHMDYSIQFNKLLYERLIKNQNITLFNPQDVPDLFEAFYTDADKFKELYEKYEKSAKLKKKTVLAKDIFSSFIQERKDTGRIYLMNVDHVNDHGSFITNKAPIRMSNLCAEITLPTKPLNYLNDDNGEIATCTLAAINWGKIKSKTDFERLSRLCVRALDNLLTYQDYPVLAAQLSSHKRRSLGIGIINFAYWLVKNNLDYQNITPEGLALVHEYTEAWSYYLIKASNELAKEIGACELSKETKYSQGILPIDTYKKDVDTLVEPVYHMNWDSLRTDLQTYGIRNSTLMALMPSETSSTVSNATNGIEPPRALVSVKQSKNGVLKQVVPEISKYKNKYDLLWNQKSPLGYIKICAVLQKFIDQAISVNTSYNPKYFPNEKIPVSVLLNDILIFYKFGGKNLYYFNTNDQQGEMTDKDFVNESQSTVIEDETCESCVI